MTLPSELAVFTLFGPFVTKFRRGSSNFPEQLFGEWIWALDRHPSEPSNSTFSPMLRVETSEETWKLGFRRNIKMRFPVSQFPLQISAVKMFGLTVFSDKVVWTYLYLRWIWLKNCKSDAHYTFSIDLNVTFRSTKWRSFQTSLFMERLYRLKCEIHSWNGYATVYVWMI